MAKSVLDIIIKLSKQGGADQETVKGLVQVKAAMMQAAAVTGTLVAAGYAVKKVFDETAGVFVNYASRVRDTMRATSLSAEEASRLIQVTDDLGVSYESLSKAIKSSADTTDFSIEGLAKTSEEYLKIANAQERAKFAQQQYGKAWVDMLGVLEKGPDAIRAASGAIGENLVLTEEGVQQAREYEIAVDDLSDSWMGLKVSIGSAIIPMVNSAFYQQRMIDLARELGATTHTEMQLFSAAMVRIKESNESATTSYTAWAKSVEQSSDATKNLTIDLQAQEEELKAISQANLGLISLIGSMQSVEENYAASYAAISNDMNLTDDERKLKFQELAAEHDLASKKIILGLLEQQLAQDGLTTQELNYLLEKGVAWGIYSQKVVSEAKIAMLEVSKIKNELNGLPSSKTININVQTNGLDSLRSAMGAGQASNPNRTYNIGGRAIGGPVTAGTPYVVGEKGPELFVPNQGGTIVPNGGGATNISGGDNYYVSLSIASPVTIADEQNVKKVLLPYIIDGIRQAKAQGSIK